MRVSRIDYMNALDVVRSYKGQLESEVADIDRMLKKMEEERLLAAAVSADVIFRDHPLEEVLRSSIINYFKFYSKSNWNKVNELSWAEMNGKIKRSLFLKIRGNGVGKWSKYVAYTRRLGLSLNFK